MASSVTGQWAEEQLESCTIQAGSFLFVLIFFFLSLGPDLEVLKAVVREHSWQAEGTICDARAPTQDSQMQGMCPTCGTIAPAQGSTLCVSLPGHLRKPK